MALICAYIDDDAVDLLDPFLEDYINDNPHVIRLIDKCGLPVYFAPEVYESKEFQPFFRFVIE